MAKKGLGRGLGALMTDKQEPQPPDVSLPAIAPTDTESPAKELPIDQIIRNPNQPRQHFDDTALDELAASIKQHGVLQPLIVRKVDNQYELIAGERRLRASGIVGLHTIPAIVIEASDALSLEIALIENLQRENLNPVEIAEGYRELGERFDLTQEQIATKTGKSRAAVANAMRLLALPDEILAMLADGRVSTGHAKVLLTVEIEAEQRLLARRIVEENLSVRALERIVKKMQAAPKKPRAKRSDLPANHVRDLSEKLHTHFGTSVRIIPCQTFANGKKSKGRLEIDFFSNNDLDRVLEQMGIIFDE